MLIYQRHIFRHLFQLFCLTSFIFTGIIWLSQALKLVYLLTKGIGITTFFMLTLLTLPSLLLTIIPLSLFLSVVFYYNRIKNDREMIVMENSGLNYLQIAKPAIVLSIILTLICYSISLYFLPFSYGKLKTKLDSLRESYTTSLLHAKAFNPISKYVTLYIDKKYNNGSLGGLIIFDYRESSDPAIIFAKHGQLTVKSDSLVFLLAKGTQQRTNTSGLIDILKFDDLVINIQNKNSYHDQDRKNKDIQEKYLYELFSPKEEESIVRISKFRAEGHQRLAWPLFNLSLTMIALAIIIPANYNRRMNLKPTIYASLFAILTVMINFMVSNLSTKNPWLDYILYFNLIIVFSISYNILRERK